MKLNKAKDLYLRGFNGEYIKRRTGISMQSLLKQLRAAGETFTKADIISYQVAYISGKYGVADVEVAYRETTLIGLVVASISYVLAVGSAIILRCFAKFSAVVDMMNSGMRNGTRNR